MKRVPVALATVLLVAGTTTGCGAGGTDSTVLTVFAAASLTPTFTRLGKEFEKSHEGVQVRFNFAGSSDLAAQLEQGAPADVFASADSENMAKTDGLVEDPAPFASNTLMIAVPPGNPRDIRMLRDLTQPDVKLVICAAQVPCGSATVKLADHAKLTFKPVSEEQSVTDVLNKVTTGQADAGLVYVTDVRSAGDKVEGVNFPESSAAVNDYPIGVVASSKQRKLADEFVALVTGVPGQEALAAAGFAKPQR